MNNCILSDYNKTKRKSLYGYYKPRVIERAFRRANQIMNEDRERYGTKYVKLYYNKLYKKHKFSTFSYFVGIKLKLVNTLLYFTHPSYQESLYSKSSKPYFKLEDYYDDMERNK